jgi:uncharacterized UBP type Zn finger protein
MVREMRLVRDDKQSLFLKFAVRMMMRHGTLEVDGELPKMSLKLGSYLPADKQEVMTIVTQCLNAKPPAISQETAIKMMIEAGYPIEDAQREVERIRQEDFATALEMLDATGDPDLVRKRLGLPPVPPEQIEAANAEAAAQAAGGAAPGGAPAPATQPTPTGGNGQAAAVPADALRGLFQ